MVGDGAGGVVQVRDNRFAAGDWPICFTVPAAEADSWPSYFYCESEKRGWSAASIGQLGARENSGSITVRAAGHEILNLVWERGRNGPINVRGRPTGTDFTLVEAQTLFAEINERSRSGATERLYRRGMLQYDGLPWRGELWLDGTLRLGPPSKQYDQALLGPRVVLVDALVECVGSFDCNSVFARLLWELGAFLSVVLGPLVHPPQQGQVWTWALTPEGSAETAVRQLGYWEAESRTSMPVRGDCRSVPLTQVSRPDFTRRGIDGTVNEMSPPADIADLWAKYRGLSAEHAQQFLQAASKWQQALSHWSESSTFCVALMIVACEALKPPGLPYRDHNVYHIVEALLGKPVAQALRTQLFDPKAHPGIHPQFIRTVHLHRGEFRGSEFVTKLMMSTFRDPTLDHAGRELAKITRAAIIEWLRRGGAVELRHLRRERRRPK